MLRVREKDERAADPPGSFPKNSNYRHYVFGWPPRLTYRLSTGGVPSRSSASKVVTVAQSVRNYTVVLYLFSRSSVQVTEHNLRTQYTVPASHQTTTNLLLTTRSAYISGLGPSTVFWPRPVLYENVHTLPPTIYIAHTKSGGMFNQHSYSMTFFKQVSLKTVVFCQYCLQNNLSLKNDLQSLFTNW